MFPQNNPQVIQVGIKLSPFSTRIGSNYEIVGKLKNCTQTKFNNVKVVLPCTAYHYLSYCNIESLCPYEIIDFRLNVSVKTSNTYSLNERGSIYIKTGSGRLLYTQEYTNQMCCYKETFTFFKPPPPTKYFNIILMGPTKSGKTMFINSCMTMFQGFSEHEIYRGVPRNTELLKRYVISNTNIALWDTWDCFDFEKEDLMRIIHGWMPVDGWKKQFRYKDFEKKLQENKDTCSTRKIHLMLFFFEKENLEDEKKMKMINNIIRTLPIPPIVILSKSDRINKNIRKNPLQDLAIFDSIDTYTINISNALKVPPCRIFNGVNYTEDDEKRSFQIDKNNFVILEQIVKSILAASRGDKDKNIKSI